VIHIGERYGQNAEFFSFKLDGKNLNRSTLKGQNLVGQIMAIKDSF
jgi:hypothetical protein